MQIFISNLNFKVTVRALKELFEKYCPVSSVRIIRDKETHRSKGYGFVDIPDEHAKEIIEKLNGTEFYERPLVVMESLPRKEEPSKTEKVD